MAVRGRSRPTMVDVAAAAGTSIAVVSWVVNDGPRPVSAETKQRVLKAIETLGYQPDRAARSLKRGRSSLLGLVVPDVTRPFFGALVREIEQRARGRDFLVLTGDSMFDASLQERTAIAYADAGVDALIMVGLAHAPRLQSRSSVPVVWVHDRPADGSGPLIASDHFEAGRIAAEHLTGVHGHRALHFIGGPDEPGVVRTRLAGVQAIADESDVTLYAHSTESFAPIHAYDAARRVLAEASHAEAIVVGTYGQTAAVVRACADAGVAIGKDIAVVSFDGDANNQFGVPVVTTVQQNVPILAELTLRAAVDEDRNEQADVRLEVELYTAESCGCALVRPVSERLAASVPHFGS